jgi:hypothetical protein
VDKALSVNGETYYRVEVGCKEGVHPFSPDLPNPPVIRKCPKSKNWFLSKRTFQPNPIESHITSVLK